jgi:hypothetical protein
MRAWFLVLLGACSSNNHHSIPVGDVCNYGAPATSPNQVILASASSCNGGACLRFPLQRELPAGASYNGDVGLCSAVCEDEGDCFRIPESPCVTGFACGIVQTVGPACCQKYCVCKDYILLPESGEPPVPQACDAANPANACCNLDGRVGNPDYPNCH